MCMRHRTDHGQSGSQRTTTTNAPLPLLPVRQRVRMTHVVESPLVTAAEQAMKQHEPPRPTREGAGVITKRGEGTVD